MRRVRPGNGSLVLGVVCLIAAGSLAVAGEAPAAAPAAPVPAESSSDDQTQLDLVVKGALAFQAGRRQEAVALYDQVINHYRTANEGEKRDIFCARDATESLFYLLRAANQQRDAKVIGRAWADAYMHRGYALVELGQVKEAREAVEAAVALAPFNAQYLAELGYLYQVDSNWDKALETYQRSAEGAETLSTQDHKPKDIARALRGQGYALIELGRLDEAERLYRRAIELDGEDPKAPNELRYIQSLRDKQTQSAK